MHILLLGINHKTAPVEVREKFYLTEERVAGCLESLVDGSGPAKEGVILSTCNRTEFYAAADALKEGYNALDGFVSGLASVPRSGYRDSIYRGTNMEAVRRLFAVAAGLDSMIVGEGQILGQVRDAHRIALAAGTSGKTLNRLFRQAVHVGKRSRTETGIARNAVSVSSAAVGLACQLFGDLSRKQALLIGAGKMTNLAVKHLKSAGVARFLVVNRTFERARDLASRLPDAEAIPFESMNEGLERADIVISSTGAMRPIVDKAMMEPIMRVRRGRRLFFVDIAVPRDVDPAVNELEHCFVYDIDDLQGVVEENLGSRRQEVERVEAIIENEVEEFRKWFSSLDVAPTLVAFRKSIEGIREAELSRHSAKLERLTEEQKNLVNAITSGLVNKILHCPTHALKEADLRQDGSFYAQALKTLFGLNVPETAETGGEGEEGEAT